MHALNILFVYTKKSKHGIYMKIKIKNIDKYELYIKKSILLNYNIAFSMQYVQFNNFIMLEKFHLCRPDPDLINCYIYRENVSAFNLCKILIETRSAVYIIEIKIWP